MLWLIALAAVVLGALCGVAHADDALVDLDAEPGRSWLREDHYGVFRGEARVGWLRRSLERGEHAGVPVVIRVMEQTVDLAGDGNEQTTLERAAYRSAPPQELLLIERSVTRQGQTSSRRIVRDDRRYEVLTVRDGKETAGVVAAFDVTLADELVVERLVAGYEGAADVEGEDSSESGTVVQELTGRSLDIQTIRRMRRTVGVLAVLGDGAERGFDIGVKTGPDAWSEPVRVDAGGALVAGPLGPSLDIRRMSREEALGTTGRTSVEEATRVPMDAELGDLAGIRELHLVVAGRDAGAGILETGRQTLGAAGGGQLLVIRRDADAGEVGAEERATALAPSPGIDCDAPEVIAAADRALSGTSRAPVQVARLLAFVAGTLENAAVLSEPSASQLLVAPRGDCTEHARLFVALARAAGLPAREVFGLVWMGDDVRAFGRHAWAEVELAGRWRVVDPTGGVLPAHAAHIRTSGNGPPDDTEVFLLKIVR